MVKQVKSPRSHSPTPTKVVKKVNLDFYEALKELNQGSSITKLEWGNRNIYGLLKDGRVMLHKSDNRYYDWIISDGDLAGDDWELV